MVETIIVGISLRGIMSKKKRESNHAVGLEYWTWWDRRISSVGETNTCNMNLIVHGGKGVEFQLRCTMHWGTRRKWENPKGPINRSLIEWIINNSQGKTDTQHETGTQRWWYLYGNRDPLYVYKDHVMVRKSSQPDHRKRQAKKPRRRAWGKVTCLSSRSSTLGRKGIVVVSRMLSRKQNVCFGSNRVFVWWLSHWIVGRYEGEQAVSPNHDQVIHS